jgi:hypothetical protein
MCFFEVLDKVRQMITPRVRVLFCHREVDDVVDLHARWWRAGVICVPWDPLRCRKNLALLMKRAQVPKKNELELRIICSLNPSSSQPGSAPSAPSATVDQAVNGSGGRGGCYFFSAATARAAATIPESASRRRRALSSTKLKLVTQASYSDVILQSPTQRTEEF